MRLKRSLTPFFMFLLHEGETQNGVRDRFSLIYNQQITLVATRHMCPQPYYLIGRKNKVSPLRFIFPSLFAFVEVEVFC